ncbi:hypothetical protein Tco_0501869 [Tanacetum coccineum]
MCTYLKNMANYKHSQLKNKSFEEIQMLFDNTMKWVDSFVLMDTKVVEGSKSQAERSKKRTREELESDNSKKQKIDENVEAEVDDEAKMKKLMEIVLDDEVATDVIPLATKSSIINIDREDLETLWKLVKAKHRDTRPEEAYERVLWGDLKDEKNEYIGLIDTSMRTIIKEEGTTQLPQILPQALYDFATPVIGKNVTESLEAVVLKRSSSQPQSTYEGAAALSEF